MSRPAVLFDRVWKKFRRGERHDSLRDLIPGAISHLTRPRGARELASEEFWALRDVSFEAERGQALGIVGPNGAGKSTTLKLLTRILKPTEGRCQIVGRVGALIEVTAGFHPDLTGRENIFLQGAIMGMKRAEIARKLDEIIDFAGIEAFVDTPVKRYSSGMNARLGFSVAAHMDPDVLVIDEVLSVGDLGFQQRCLARMAAFKRQGITIVFVSHHLQAVAELCDIALHLRQSVCASGPTSAVLKDYISASHQAMDTPRSSAFRLVNVRLQDEDHGVPDVVASGESLRLSITWQVDEPLSDLSFRFTIYRSTDNAVASDAHISDVELGLGPFRPGDLIELAHVFQAHLARGLYHVECSVFHNPTQTILARICPAATFRTMEHRTHRCIADVKLQCSASHRRAARDEPIIAMAASGEPSAD
jgi:lipopolysaccharide transport system ATP-binding protein